VPPIDRRSGTGGQKRQQVILGSGSVCRSDGNSRHSTKSRGHAIDGGVFADSSGHQIDRFLHAIGQSGTSFNGSTAQPGPDARDIGNRKSVAVHEQWHEFWIRRSQCVIDGDTLKKGENPQFLQVEDGVDVAHYSAA